VTRNQGSFPAGKPGNGVRKVILTVGTTFKTALGELYKKQSVLPVFVPFLRCISQSLWVVLYFYDSTISVVHSVYF